MEKACPLLIPGKHSIAPSLSPKVQETRFSFLLFWGKKLDKKSVSLYALLEWIFCRTPAQRGISFGENFSRQHGC
jgi:hypothetical protein